MIQVKPSWESEKPLYEYIVDEMRDRTYESGVVEMLRIETEKNREVLARLITLLAEKEILTVPEVGKIVSGCDNTLKEVKPQQKIRPL